MTPDQPRSARATSRSRRFDLDRPARVTTSSDEPLVAWLAIWHRPRAAIRQIVARQPGWQVHLIAAFSGADAALCLSAAWGGLAEWGPLTAWLVAFTAGIAMGLVGLYLLAGVTTVTAHAWGGEGSAAATRSAVGWGLVPAVATVPLWVAVVSLLGAGALGAPWPSAVGDGAWSMEILAFVAIKCVCALWALGVMSAAVAEMHEVSTPRGIAAIVFSLLPLVWVLAPPASLVLAVLPTG